MDPLDSSYGMTYDVTYPSGTTFTIRGRFRAVHFDSVKPLLTPVIEQGPPPAGRVMVLDPRAVITDRVGRVVFHGCTTEQLVATQP